MIATPRLMNQSSITRYRKWYDFTKRLIHRNINKTSQSSLRKVFDDQEYWENANSSTYDYYRAKLKAGSKYLLNTANVPAAETGLFQNSLLTSPIGLQQFTKRSRKEAEDLVNLIRTDMSADGIRNYIVRLDQLSDILCRVIDLCEFIRAAHPDEKFVTTAQECHEQMYEVMNILNTDVFLWKHLKKVLSEGSIRSQLTDEEVRVGIILLEDFEKSGIYMNPEVREQFIQLAQDISIVGQEFNSNTEYNGVSHVKICAEELEASGMNRMLFKDIPKDVYGTKYKVPTTGGVPYVFLRSCPSEAIRKKIWNAMYSCPKKQIKRLEALMTLRKDLAKSMGKKSYAAYQMEGKMAKSPKNVQDFINTLIAYTKPLATEELKPLADMKNEHLCRTSTDVLSTVRPWDRDYYGYLHSMSKRTNISPESPPISSYFSLGVVLEGVSGLLQSIYGIKLVPIVPKTGETWAPDVRKLQVVSETDGVIGVIYCDLFERTGKTPNPAHFTVCCSRHLYLEEKDLSRMQLGRGSDGKLFQMPIISLVCNFTRSNIDGNSVCLLQLSEVETLFHEMGHAIHTMVGRTELQNTSGTRCVTDFVELPSILMEHFAKDSRVLSTISSHYVTGERVPDELLAEYQQEKRFLQHTETFAQIKMASLDQKVHSFEGETADAVKLYHEVEKELQVLADTESNWCGKFGHLFGYGATYYSYLMDRAIAAKIWNYLFENDPFSREGGEKFKNSVLKWGGSRDPWHCIADALDEPRLAEGDQWAMKYIGEVENM
ncbi:HFL065Cp [Eremothecium sinecaudum]|uniref:Mitochondrial intermediate peptidase n=1 Tax=Eremothecium sinecaudum TaxID=45286 RepID=A0A0X8HTZ1_9SACH|nr:HFL065Cp [Eremothecium sinecaudum]AMD21791.1 HFL065Cp [Eremothecium sinecaudum]